MKRILAVLISFLLIIQGISVTASAASEEESTQTKAEFMKAIGVMTALPSNYDANVNRAEFAMYAAKIINISEYDEADRRLFLDVPMKHWATSAINGLVDRGVISSDSEGKFRLDDDITVEEAVKMLVCILGYKPYAEAYGGFPMGYMSAARECGITISPALSNASLTYGRAIEMIYDTLNTEVLEGREYASKSISYSKGERTLLEIYRGIHRTEGKVNAADGVSINGDFDADYGEIVVGNKAYTFECDPFEYLGRYVTLYYKGDEGEKGEVVYAIADSRDNKVIKFNAEDFNKYDASANRVTYTLDGQRKRNLTVGADLSVIKNGTAITTGVEDTINNVCKGTYTFVNCDGNGHYETLLIDEYMDVPISRVDAANNKIYDKYRQGVYIDVAENTDKKVLIYRDGIKVSLSDVTAGSMLTVYESEKYTRIYVSNASVTGQITQVKKANDKTNVYIGDKWYEVDDGVEENIDIRIGLEGNFALDIFGKIAYFGSGGAPANYRCGYVIDHAPDGAFRDTLKLKLYVPTVGIGVYTLAERVRIDGVSESDGQKKINLLQRYSGSVDGQVIYFRETDGVIKEIDTPYYDPENENEYSIKRNESATGVFYRSRKFGKRIITNADTLILAVPSDKNLKSAKESEFSTPAAGNISISLEYGVDSYKFDLDSGFDDVVVIKDYVSTTPTYELVMVDEITTAYKDEEVVEQLKYYYAGVPKECYVSPEKSLLDKGIKQGDLLRIGLNSEGEIEEWIVIFSYKPDALPSDVNELHYDRVFNDNNRIIFGYAKSANDGVLKLYRNPSDPNALDELFNVSTAKITVYDSSAVKNNTRITEGIYHDISTYDTNGVPSMVIVRVNLASLQDVVVYK